MHSQAFLAALFVATAAGAPLAPKARQLSATDPMSAISGLLGGLGGGSEPTGIPSLPTSLAGGFGGGSVPTGIPSLATNLPNRMDLPSGIPTGLLSGLPTALPTGVPSGLGGDSSSESGVPSYPSPLFDGLEASGSSGTMGNLLGDQPDPDSSNQKRQLGGTSTSSGASSLTSLLSGLGSGTSTTSSGSSLSSLLSGLTGSASTGSTSSLAGGSDTENGLSNACKTVTLIFARGTTESGNVGSVVGPGLTTDVSSALNNDVNVQGVEYAADAAGIASEATGPGTGSEAMIADVQAALAKCPNTQIVLSGYSQGAMLVHNTMGALNTTAAAAVKAAVTFGDPFVGEAIKNLASADWKSFCATDDPVCDSGAASSPASGGTTSASTMSHLGYGADTKTAATFIKGKVTI